jgi:hypothetical protein
MTERQQQHVTCECTISFHYVTMPNGDQFAVWNEEPPAFAQMMWGRCDRCKLPYHTEFSLEEPA